jgi:ABC-type nitrate/sulfonate/bicarbonate transport system ATPase subunit
LLHPPAIEVAGLTAVYQTNGRRVPALGGLDLSAPAGGFVSLVGPSGCGKSTLFNVLTGLTPPESGLVRVDGRPRPNLRGLAAYMQQKDLLLPWRTVLGNAVLGLEVAGVDAAEAQSRAIAMLDEFGLAGFTGSFPDELSGGMRQRAALVRTMLCGRPVLLLDEPFGALDAITRRSLRAWLLEAWQAARPTVLLVTHDVEEALLLSDRVYVLSPRPGRVRAVIEMDQNRPRRASDPELARLREEVMAGLEAPA